MVALCKGPCIHVICHSGLKTVTTVGTLRHMLYGYIDPGGRV